MYRILTLTDFSENSKSALEFTKLLAIHAESVVNILHALSPISGTITLNEQSVELNNILFENSKEKMDEIVTDFNTQRLSPNAIIKRGVLHEVLASVMNEFDINLIVISTHGRGSNFEKIIGKDASYILANIHSPILIIPSKFKIGPIKNASFVHQLEKPKLNHLTEVFKLLKAFDINEIDLLHIHSEEQDVSKADKSILPIIKESFPNKKIHFHFIEGEFVVDSLYLHLKEKQTDLLIISANKKTFWKRLISGNIHLQSSIQFDIPILILTDSPS